MRKRKKSSAPEEADRREESDRGDRIPKDGDAKRARRIVKRMIREEKERREEELEYGPPTDREDAEGKLARCQMRLRRMVPALILSPFPLVLFCLGFVISPLLIAVPVLAVAASILGHSMWLAVRIWLRASGAAIDHVSLLGLPASFGIAFGFMLVPFVFLLIRLGQLCKRRKRLSAYLAGDLNAFPRKEPREEDVGERTV